MRLKYAIAVAGIVLAFQPGLASGQATAVNIWLLKDTGNNQWCAYPNEATWNTAVQGIGAMTVGELHYSGKRLQQIDVTDSDETGDWIVYDNYFLDDRGQIVKLSRTANVQPGDRSVVQTYVIADGKAKKTETTQTQLSTGKLLKSPKSVWLPKIPISIETKSFPFFGLLNRPGLMTSNKTCIAG